MDSGIINEYPPKHTIKDIMNKNPYLFSITACLILTIAYVASLYVWSSPHNRDHPATIKKRFLSISVMMIISPLYLSFFITSEKFDNISIFELLGFRCSGLLSAAIIPLLLTMILFLGPLCMQGLSDSWDFPPKPLTWVSNIKDLIWWRNHVVAPLSEEFAFRACMLPLLLQCFEPMTAIFICPLFFGSAHLHHMYERVKCGVNIRSALLISCIEFFYTTLFGMYSALLFVKTGHFIAPFIAHTFCNAMGFPDFSEIFSYENPKKSILVILFLAGLLLWCYLIIPLTNPAYYDNNLFLKLQIQ